MCGPKFSMRPHIFDAAYFPTGIMRRHEDGSDGAYFPCHIVRPVPVTIFPQHVHISPRHEDGPDTDVLAASSSRDEDVT